MDKFEQLKKELDEEFEKSFDELDRQYGLNKYMDRNIERETPKPSNNRRSATIRNKGKKVGTENYYVSNFKRMILVGAFGVVLGATAGSIVTARNIKPDVVVVNTLRESDFREPSYSGIEYTIKSGDTLWDIVARYEDDRGKIPGIVNRIERLNHINSGIRSGQVIVLCDVPSSKLEEYGYSDNLGYFAPSIEIDIRVEFLNKVYDNLSMIDDPEIKEYVDSIGYCLDNYNAYRYNKTPDATNNILNELRIVCDEAKHYGYDFDYNKKALPLSEAVSYNQESNRAL